MTSPGLPFECLVPCRGEWHRVALTERGRFIMPEHSCEDLDNELALAALAEDPSAACGCLRALLWWRRHSPRDGVLFWLYPEASVPGRITKGGVTWKGFPRWVLHRGKRGKIRREVRLDRDFVPEGFEQLAWHAFQEHRRWCYDLEPEDSHRCPMPIRLHPKDSGNGRRRYMRALGLLLQARWRWSGGLGPIAPRSSSLTAGLPLRRRRPRSGASTRPYRHVMRWLDMSAGSLDWLGDWRSMGLTSPKGVALDPVAYLNMRARLGAGLVDDGRWKALLLRLYQQPAPQQWEALAVRRRPGCKGRKLSFWVQHCVIERVRGFKWKIAEWLGEPLGKSVEMKSRKAARPAPAVNAARKVHRLRKVGPSGGAPQASQRASLQPATGVGRHAAHRGRVQPAGAGGPP